MSENYNENSQSSRPQRRENNNNKNKNRSRQGNNNKSRPKRNFQPRKHQKKLSFWQKILRFLGLYKPQAHESTKGKFNQKTTRVQSDNSSTQEKPARVRREHNTEIQSSRLYLGNLSYDVTESDLEDLFKGIGPVKSIEIIYNRNTHRSKGYGFAEMLNIDDAKKAIEVLDDQPFMGRKLSLSGAKEKQYQDKNDDSNDSSDNEPKITTIIEQSYQS